MFVGASLPPRLAKLLEMTIPGLRRVTLKSLHRKPQSLVESFVECGVHDKHAALLAALHAEGVLPTSAESSATDIAANATATATATATTTHANAHRGDAGSASQRDSRRGSRGAGRGGGRSVDDDDDDIDIDMDMDDDGDDANTAAEQRRNRRKATTQPNADNHHQQNQHRHRSQWMVFCNTIQSCRSTEFFLAENGYAGTHRAAVAVFAKPFVILL